VAWVDDRIWCHPKYANVSKPARWTAVSAIAYSSGFGTAGVLSNGQLAQIGATPKERRELVAAGLWHDLEDGIQIHDWDEHNSSRDERKAKDRERKRAVRAAAKSTGTSADSPQDTARTNNGQLARRPHVEARAGGRPMTSEGSEELNPRAVALNAAVNGRPLTAEERTALEELSNNTLKEVADG
jgi:hypothetical protein